MRIRIRIFRFTLGATSEELSTAAEEATSSSEQVSNTLGQIAYGIGESIRRSLSTPG